MTKFTYIFFNEYLKYINFVITALWSLLCLIILSAQVVIAADDAIKVLKACALNLFHISRLGTVNETGMETNHF